MTREGVHVPSWSVSVCFCPVKDVLLKPAGRTCPIINIIPPGNIHHCSLFLHYRFWLWKKKGREEDFPSFCGESQQRGKYSKWRNIDILSQPCSCPWFSSEPLEGGWETTGRILEPPYNTLRMIFKIYVKAYSNFWKYFITVSYLSTPAVIEERKKYVQIIVHKHQLTYM